MKESSEQTLQFTPTFLNEVLQPILEPNQTAVTEVRAEKLTGDSDFNASLWRLYLTYDRPTPFTPPTLIAKLPTVKQELHAHAAVFQPGRRENWFYQSAAPHTPVNVPHCYYNATDTTNQSILLLQDLAPARSDSWVEGLTIPQAKLAVESLARFQASWWGGRSRAEIQELTTLISDNWTEEQNLVQNLYDKAWPQFLAQGMIDIPDEVRHFGTAMVGNMKLVDELIELAPKTLVHGDYRLGNILFGSMDNQLTCWVIDWEDVFFGSGLVDVSWLLGGCLPLTESTHETDLLQHYHQTLVDGGVQDYSWAACYEDYRRAMCNNFVQGVLSAVLDEGATQHEQQVAQAIGERFVAAVQRLQLLDVII